MNPTALIVSALITLAASWARAADIERFKSPEAAAKALVEAARQKSPERLMVVLGPDADDLIDSGDPVADQNARKRFAAEASARMRVELQDASHAILYVGKGDWPLPIPIVKDGDTWRFDTALGKDELINRRIGRNELNAIAVEREFVAAEREYARRGAAKGRPGPYAQRVLSQPGKRDGLYWEDETGKDPSPMGPRVAEAAGEGYDQLQGGEPRPYRGYFFRTLTAQGPHAPGGARSYVQDGQMTGGFAMLAWPAEYGSSGIMTFIVDEHGIVFQKNLGEKTAELAKAMTAYDPDESWDPAR